MYALPLNDTEAIALTRKKSSWRVHYLSFDPFRVVDTFKMPGAGTVYSATVNPDTGALWVLAGHSLYLVSRKNRTVGRAPLPEQRMLLNDIEQIGNRYYLSSDAGRLWTYDVSPDVDAWVSLFQPPPGARASDDWIKQYPAFHKTVAAGDDRYFLAGFGRLVRLRGEHLEEIRLPGSPRLVAGGAEDDQVVLCSDNPQATIYQGTLETRFEPLFEHDDRALHLTALHEGTRFIGAAADHPNRMALECYTHEGPCLFTLDQEGLVPVETGCHREPGSLLKLVSTGGVLWAIDQEGLFRLTPTGWQLTEFREIRMFKGP